MGIEVRPDGFCRAVDIAGVASLRSLGCSSDDLARVVRLNDKQRFELRGEGPFLEIRAVQGHSMKVVDDERLLKRLSVGESLPEVCVHGTYWRYLESIHRLGLLAGGLQRSRNHVHFVPRDPKRQVISGMRSDCEVAIWLDLRAALRDGLPFFTSTNQVLLSPGFGGVVATKYFTKVKDLWTGKWLPLPPTDNGSWEEAEEPSVEPVADCSAALPIRPLPAEPKRMPRMRVPEAGYGGRVWITGEREQVSILPQSQRQAPGAAAGEHAVAEAKAKPLSREQVSSSPQSQRQVPCAAAGEHAVAEAKAKPMKRAPQADVDGLRPVPHQKKPRHSFADNFCEIAKGTDEDTIHSTCEEAWLPPMRSECVTVGEPPEVGYGRSAAGAVVVRIGWP